MSMDSIKELRERTGAGIMDCKTALKETGGNMEAAIDTLRKKGMAQAAKRAGRQASEGLIVSRLNGHKAALVEVNCETDFVARTQDFKDLADLALEEVLNQGESAISSGKITERIAELTGKIGEKILIRRAKLIQTPENGLVSSYVHFNGKLGALVELSAVGSDASAAGVLGKDIAMQVANSNPLALSRSEVPATAVQREKAIFQEEVKGKPENILEKIVQGKLDKFYQANCLLEQPFIKEDKISIQELLQQTSKKLGGTISVKQFVRFQLGEALV